MDEAQKHTTRRITFIRLRCGIAARGLWVVKGLDSSRHRVQPRTRSATRGAESIQAQASSRERVVGLSKRKAVRSSSTAANAPRSSRHTTCSMLVVWAAGAVSRGSTNKATCSSSFEDVNHFQTRVTTSNIGEESYIEVCYGHEQH